MLDNGAFSAWTRGEATDWTGFYAWCDPWLDYWSTWAVIPDVIGGSESDNDALIDQWPHGERGAPVWHMNGSIQRLRRLAERWPRVCIGSAGEYRRVGDAPWHRRMVEVFNALCPDERTPCRFHMLRGGQFLGSHYPFASVDSTNVARNHAPKHSRGERAFEIAAFVARLESRQCPARWVAQPEQSALWSA